MSILIVLAALSVSLNTPTLPSPVVLKTTTDIGLYSVKTNQMNADELKAKFKKHLRLQDAEYQKTGGSLSEPWKDFGKLKDEITWQTLVRYQPEWRYTDSDNSTWIYQAPDFGNNWPTKVIQIADKSTSNGYKVEVTAYCSGTETECTPYFAAQKNMLAPRPNLMQSDMAYKQWRNRVSKEACSPLPKNMSNPRYPAQALRDGIGGTVRLGVYVNACGNVRDVWIETSSRNRDLDRAALNEAKRWQFDMTTLPGNLDKSGIIIAPVIFSPE